MFVFYTNQSNAVIAVYHLLLLISGFFEGSGLCRFLKAPTMQFSMTVMIWVTHIVYHFVLVPLHKKSKKKYEDNRHGLGNACVHYIAPLLTLLEWVLCADKNITFLSCVIWLIIPALYFIFAILRGRTGVPIGNTSSAYPYAFMDLDALGAKKFARNIIAGFCFFFILALLLLGAVKLAALF